MWTYNHTDELYHHGVKGMRWGVRRDRKRTSGSNGQSVYKKAVNKFVNSKVGSKYKLKDDPKAERKEIEGSPSKKEKILERFKKKLTKENAAKAVAKGARMASKAAMYSMADDVFFGGAGKKVLKETVKQTGRAAVTAWVMANGGYDIRWFDK